MRPDVSDGWRRGFVLEGQQAAKDRLRPRTPVCLRSERQVENAIAHCVRLHHFGQNFQISNALPNRCAYQSRVYQSRKRDALSLSSVCFAQEVIVEGKQNTVEHRRTREQIGIVRSPPSVFLSGQNVDVSGVQSSRDRIWDVHVHVKADGRHASDCLD